MRLPTSIRSRISQATSRLPPGVEQRERQRQRPLGRLGQHLLAIAVFGRHDRAEFGVFSERLQCALGHRVDRERRCQGNPDV